LIDYVGVVYGRAQYPLSSINDQILSDFNRRNHPIEKEPCNNEGKTMETIRGAIRLVFMYTEYSSNI
jgi:hypothetical protein